MNEKKQKDLKMSFKKSLFAQAIEKAKSVHPSKKNIAEIVNLFILQFP